MGVNNCQSFLIVFQYATEAALLADIDLLCTNAKLYNEEGTYRTVVVAANVQYVVRQHVFECLSLFFFSLGSDIYVAAVKFEETVKRAQKTLDSALAPGSGGGSTSPRRSATQARRLVNFYPLFTSPLTYLC